MELNILKIILDRSGRLIDSQNLSLNQCSSDNRIKVYYQGEYDYIEMSFRKPDGWLSDKVTLTFDVDEENNKFAYYDIAEDFVTFPMGGRNAILTGNLYLHKDVDGTKKVASLGNIRINVNYVDDSLVHTNYSENYMANINSQIGAIQNDLNRFKTGDVLVGKAVADRKGNTIDIYYETKADALDKYDDLNQKKLDKSEVQDQTNRLELLEANATNISGILNSIEKVNTTQSNLISENTSEIDSLKTTTVTLERFKEESSSRVARENELQEQINELASSSNVNDIVGSFSALLAYDTSDLEIGYKILVSEDKNQGGVSTVYRYTGDGSFNGFEYIGKYASSSYTKTEINTKLDELLIPNELGVSENSLYLQEDGVQISKTPIKFKTINGESIFGSTNITYPVDSELDATSENPVQNKIITAQLEQKASILQLGELKTELTSKIEGKQDSLKAGSNITITEDGTISVTSAIRFEKVESLPTTGSSNIIYLLKTVNDEDHNEIYTEYYWDEENSRWESLGDATINLSNYYTINETNNLLSNKANQSALDSLATEVSTNKTDIATKASQASVDTVITSINVINTALSAKADSSELEKYALKESIPDISTKQDKLVSGQNIKTINGVSLLGYGDLLIADTKIVDLGNYVLNDDLNTTLETYALKTELFDLDYTKLKNLPDLEIFATETEMSDYVAAQIAAIPPTDLSGYYTKEETDSAISNHIPDLSGYATEEYVKTEINTLLGGVDEAYDTLKEISEYIASDETNAAAMLASINKNTENITLNTGYIDKLEVRVDNTIASNAAEFATRYTKDEVNELLNEKLSESDLKTINGESLIGSGNIELTANLDNYYNKTQVDSLVNAKSTVKANPGTYTGNLSTITIDGTNYSVKTDLSNYYTKTEVDNAISNVEVDLSGYATEEYVNEQVKEEITTLLDSAPEAYDTFKEIADYIESDLSNTAAMLASINNKADKSEVYTQTEANSKFATKDELPTLPDMSQYYTKDETTDVIDKITGLDNYYEKTEIDAKLLNKQDILVSGSTIKTINGESIVGYGDLEITGTTVIGNPELDGGEEILESIQIEDVKYSLQGQDMIFSETTSENADRKVLKTITIENEDWIVDKGSVVTPNVELSGDEEVLESVQIDDAVFTLKGEEMIFSETEVDGATPLRNIQLGDDNWGIPKAVTANPELDGSEEQLTSLTIDNVNYSLYGNTLELSTESIDGAESLASITINGDSWNIVGSGSSGSVDLTGYATEEWVNSQGFIQEHQSLVGYATEEYVDTKVAELVNSAPETLDTLGELAEAFENNQEVVDALNSAITNKADIDDVYTKSEIDEQFSTLVPNIVYSETEPENPVLGMIWLKPAE